MNVIEVKVGNFRDEVVDESVNYVVNKFDIEFGLFSLEVEPDCWNIVPNMSSGIIARALIA